MSYIGSNTDIPKEAEILETSDCIKVIDYVFDRLVIWRYAITNKSKGDREVFEYINGHRVFQ
jgi:hypothetical protein